MAPALARVRAQATPLGVVLDRRSSAAAGGAAR
jgi:hypothetical protein